MVYRSIFGQDLTDNEVEILIDNGIGEEVWQRILRQTEKFEHNRDRSLNSNKIRRAMKAAGIAGGAINAAYRVWTMSNTRNKGEKRGHLRGTSFFNLLWEEQAPGYKYEGEHTKILKMDPFIVDMITKKH